MKRHICDCGRTRLQRHGFTLIEVMVAIAALALLSLMAWRGLDAMLSIESHTAAHDRQVATLQSALTQWGMDLDALQPLPHTTALDWDGQVLRLTRRSHFDTSQGVIVVAWTRRMQGEQSHWLRWQSPSVVTRQQWQQAWEEAQAWAQMPSTAQQSREVVLLPLRDWQLFYYRGNAWTHPLSSSDTAALEGEKGKVPIPVNQSGMDAETLQLPDGVRLQLDLPAGHPLSGRLIRDWINPRLGGGKA